MIDYTELLKDLRYCVYTDNRCRDCKRYDSIACQIKLMKEATAAIEELLKEREEND